MDKHIEKLMSFIEKHDLSKYLNTLSKDDKDLKEIWKQVQSDQEWNKIRSSKDVEALIKHFENYVLTSPSDIRERNYYKDGMFIAQYKALRGIRKWCQSIDENRSSLSNLDFPKLTEYEVDRLIYRLDYIIKKI